MGINRKLFQTNFQFQMPNAMLKIVYNIDSKKIVIKVD